MDALIGLKKSGEFQAYSVWDLVDRIDCVLAEYGCIRCYIGFDEENGNHFRKYKAGVSSALVRFVDNESDFLELTEDDGVKSRCPVYINLKNVPREVANSIKRDVKKI